MNKSYFKELELTKENLQKIKIKNSQIDFLNKHQNTFNDVQEFIVKKPKN